MAEVYDAEVMGALKGLQRALNKADRGHPIHVCLDNTSVISSLKGIPGDSSQKAFIQFQLLARRHSKVYVHWSPGYKDIKGNERADALAKSGCRIPSNNPPTLAYIRRTNKAKALAAFKEYWHKNMPTTYEPLDLPIKLGPPDELTLERRLLQQLLAARTHHSDFAAYHKRFSHANSTNTCSCRRKKAPHHIFYCHKIKPAQRLGLATPFLGSIYQVIGRNYKQFIKHLKATKFFTDTCPRH
jgi:hypothetical protein